MNKLFGTTLGLLTICMVGTAEAHILGAETSIAEGLMHPITGLDHLCMLLAMGVVTALAGKKFIMPILSMIIFMVGMILGCHIGEIPYIEFIVASSLLVSATLLFLKPNIIKVLMFVLPILMFFHGYAHGAEAPLDGVWQFMIGSVITATFLISIGYIAGLYLGRFSLFKTGLAGSLVGIFAIIIAD